MDAQTATMTSSLMPGISAQAQMRIFMVVMIRSMIRKGIGLWKSGSKKQLTWFIFMFIFNTVGILPIIYLAFFQKKNK